MERIIRLLAINPGSTSTKIAVFEDENCVFSKNVKHADSELAKYPEIPDQLPYRKEMILDELKKNGYDIADMQCFVGRGGGLNSCDGGTYNVEGILLEHARTCHAAKHPSTLGAVIANEFAQMNGCRAFIVDPPDVDELEPLARVSGLKDYPRQSRNHTLNQKEVARRAAAELGKGYDECNFVVAHLGGGISVAAHKKGRIVDVNDIINGDGPMAPTRCGQVAVADIISLCFSGNYTEKEIRGLVNKNGGVVNHLGTSDMLEVENRVIAGDEYAELVFKAMLYQVSKSIGANAAVLGGKVDAVVITGGMARAKMAVEFLQEKVGFIGPMKIYPGEFEMEALANGALRVLRGEEEAKTYSGIPIWSGFDCAKQQ